MKKCINCKFLVKRVTRGDSKVEDSIYFCVLLLYSLDRVQANDEVDCWRYRGKKRGGEE